MSTEQVNEQSQNEPVEADQGLAPPKSYPLLSAAELQRVLSRTSEHSFAFNIQRMNQMYKLPILTAPTLEGLTKPNGTSESASNRIKGFLRTLHDEVLEGNEILVKLCLIESSRLDTVPVTLVEWVKTIEERLGIILSSESATKCLEFADLVQRDYDEAVKDVLVDIADWTGDIMVYCRSEAMKFGLPSENVLEAIMGSNFTKLPSDGIPVHDANGKFLKDMTNFVPPEPAIKTMLFGLKPEPTVDADGNVKATVSPATQSWFGIPDSDPTVKMSNNVYSPAEAGTKDTGFVD